MNDAQKTICEAAIKVLMATPYGHPYRAIRVRCATDIETQMLIGLPELDEACVVYASQILDAVREEQEHQAAEIANNNEWLGVGDQTALAYGSHQLNPDGTSTPEWFDSIKPVSF